MSDTTPRDKVWTQVLARLLDHESIRKGDLDIEDSERNTAQRVFRAMEEIGILTRESPAGTTWHRGEAWFWMTKSNPGAEVRWSGEQEELVFVEAEDD